MKLLYTRKGLLEALEDSDGNPSPSELDESVGYGLQSL
jgi:hypothetical protein